MKPPRSILDKKFRYVPAALTDVGATIRRIQREAKENQIEAQAKVAPLNKRRTGT